MRHILRHGEQHFTDRTGWLRAAVLGANDGIVSTASLIVGVASASPGRNAALVAGIAGLVAGAMSMAAGEYVSVSSQADTEKADLAKERAELHANPVGERDELAGIYRRRGLDAALAEKVADELMTHDALEAHARDELGISDTMRAKPVQASLTSAASFSAGAGLPLIVVALAPLGYLVPWVISASLVYLAVLGAISAYAGGAELWRPTLRVTFWGALAMLVTAGIGRLIGVGV
ncbi:MAG: VIT family protein [Alphaproteobacteria bacterium]|nr:VIT family protein [Alphaproteobacteria bacterium]